MRSYDFKDKKIALLGFGKSNREVLEYIYKYTQDISVFDQNNKDGHFDINEKYKNITIYYGNDCFRQLNGFDYIFRSPAIRPDNEYITREVDRGALLTSESEFFISACKGKTIGVTGSDGKTTTCSLIYEIIKNAGKKVILGGNIGVPLIGRLDHIDSDTYAVIELSSFQLMTFSQGTDIAVITNISPNHLDYHRSYAEYIQSKRKIAKCSDKNSIVVLNGKDKGSINYFKKQKCNIEYFNSSKGIYYKNGIISKDGSELVDTSRMLIRGRHNIDDLMAAIASVGSIAGPDAVREAAYNFKGVEHRTEFTDEIKGVIYINDSIATSPTRTTAGLRSFDQKVILIAGGKDKGISYLGIGSEIKEHVRYLILLGQTKDAILKSALEADPELRYSITSSLEEAVKKAYDVSHDGDIVLFSPASTSFDMFSNFEERGKKFKECVRSLKELI
jgi:UDP-N-acetylmuramoylalanine--D-glutamate ligase